MPGQMLGLLLLLALFSNGFGASIDIITGPASASFSTSEAGQVRYVLKQIHQLNVAVDPDEEDQAEFHFFDSTRGNIWVVDSTNEVVNVVKLLDDGSLNISSVIDVSAFGSPNSVAVHPTEAVVAVACSPGKDQNGVVVFFNAITFAEIRSESAGRLPDHVSFGPGGSCAYTANEGEPSEGTSTTINEESGGITSICAAETADFLNNSSSLTVDTFTFSSLSLSSAEIDKITTEGGWQAFTDLRPNPSQALLDDLEPEYISYGTPDSQTGVYELYVVCQENNLFAVFSSQEVGAPTFERFQLLGYKDHSIAYNAIDHDKKDGINIQTMQVLGMYQPDTVKVIRQNGVDYIVTANEGDAKTWGEDYFDDESIFTTLTEVKLNNTNGVENSGKSEVALNPPTDTNYGFGGRSYSVWNARNGDLVYDSGSEMERMIEKYLPEFFNVKDGTHIKDDVENDNLDNRSGKKGPEPESIASGVSAAGDHLLFVGIERTSVIGIWDINDISQPIFHSLNGYTNCNGDTMNNIDPEAITFIAATDSPTNTDLLIASGSVSNTLTVYELVCSSSPAYLGKKQEPGCPGFVDLPETTCASQDDSGAPGISVSISSAILLASFALLLGDA